MVKPLHYAALALVLATQTGDASCQDDTARSVAYDCHVDARGLRNENGLVVDLVSHWCDPTPQTEKFAVWIEARPGPLRDSEPVGRTSMHLIPPKLGTTVRTRVEGGRCQPDVEYATAWSATGVDSNGAPFDTGSGNDLYWTWGLC